MNRPPSVAIGPSLDSEGRQSLLRLLFWVYTIVAVSYVVWRFQSTLSYEHYVFGSIFFAAEVACLVSSLAFYATVCTPPRGHVSRPPRSGHKVDVFVTTYDEDPELVRSTVVSARDMDYPHETWICDDGNRSELRKLASELGVGYIARPDNEHFKAGNLNHAMSMTEGDFIVVLDADHLLASEFLTELLGYFDEDSELALVQIPQVYYNVDSYQHSVSSQRRALWHEASIFHHRMQPGADARGAAFFVGTGAILRRRCLEEIGGFATDSITEDIHTSIRIHAAGFRTRYVDRALGYLLAPETPLAYACQRLRWAQGAMQVLRGEPRLWGRGLRSWQRVGYLNSLAGYLFAYQHLVFYLAPGIFLYAGISPIDVDANLGFPIFVAYIAFSLAVYKTIAAPEARIFLGECYKMLNLAIHIRGSFSLLWPSGLTFRVTPKGKHRGLPAFLVIPAAALFLFNLTAVGAGVVQLVHGVRPLGALLLTTLFAGFFSVAGALALLHAIERRGHVEPFVFPVFFSGALQDSTGREIAIADVRRINHHFVYLSLSERVPEERISSLSLQRIGIERVIGVHAVEHQEIRSSGRSEWIVKLCMEPLEGEERDALDRYLVNVALPKFFACFDPDSVSAPEKLGQSSLFPEDFRYLPVRAEIV